MCHTSFGPYKVCAVIVQVYRYYTFVFTIYNFLTLQQYTRLLSRRHLRCFAPSGSSWDIKCITVSLNIKNLYNIVPIN